MASKIKEKDNGWNALRKTLAKVGGKKVVVGIPGEVNFSAPNAAAIGTVHEFGSLDGVIPERSFLRSTFDMNKKKYSDLMVKESEKAVKAKAPEERALFVVGETVRADVINRIRDKDIRQELNPRTIARKGSDTALVDTGNLVGSIVSKVVNK